MIIAIDGPVASGKSTTACLAAQRLGFVFFDTGLTYRSVGLAVLRCGVDPVDYGAVIRITGDLPLTIQAKDHVARVFLGDEDVTDALWESEVATAGSQVAGIPKVREILVRKQQRAVGARDMVVAGRDIGTVVFSDASLKIYLDASAEARAHRRYDEYCRRGMQTTYESVYTEIVDRDKRDMERTESPLMRASDAVLIDTSDLSVDEQVEQVLVLAIRTRRSGITCRSQ